MTEESLISSIKDAAKRNFSISLSGIHGVAHWDRVHENAVYLAKHTRADTAVVRSFAYLHDCCRQSDGSDPDHGLRAADFALSLRPTILNLTDEQFELLHLACRDHEKGRTSEDPTIGSCWDADRLDLGRVGIKPRTSYLSTAKAQTTAVREWGYKRSRGHKATLNG